MSTYEPLARCDVAKWHLLCSSFWLLFPQSPQEWSDHRRNKLVGNVTKNQNMANIVSPESPVPSGVAGQVSSQSCDNGLCGHLSSYRSYKIPFTNLRLLAPKVTFVRRSARLLAVGMCATRLSPIATDSRTAW